MTCYLSTDPAEMAYAQQHLNEALIPSKVRQYPNYQKTSSTILGTGHAVVVVTIIVINSAGVAMHDTIGWDMSRTMALKLGFCLLVSTKVVAYIYVYNTIMGTARKTDILSD